MLLKNLIFNFNLYFNNFYLYFSLLFLYFIFFFFFTNKLRLKFFYTFGIIFFSLFWGFFCNIDSLTILFFNIELGVLFFLVSIYSQIYTKLVKSKLITKFSKNKIKIFVLLFLSLFFFSSLHHYCMFFQYTQIYLYVFSTTTFDFFNLYKFFYVDNVLLSVLLVLILSFFGFFFILIYFFLRELGKVYITKKKTYSLLRKQSFVHQSYFQANLRSFKLT